MPTRSKSKSPKKSNGPRGKSRNESSGESDSGYPNIIEEPIRIVGDHKRGGTKTGKSLKQSTKRSTQGSNATVVRKSGKKKRS